MNTVNFLTMKPCCRLLIRRRNLGFSGFLSSSKRHGSFTKRPSNFDQNRKFHSYPSGILGFQCVSDRTQQPFCSPNLSWGQSRFFSYKFNDGFIGRSENLIARVSSNARSNSGRVETRVNDKNFERTYAQDGLNVKPLLGKIDTDENVDRDDGESREGIEVEDVKNENSVGLNEAEVASGGREVSEAEKEAWKLLQDAVVTYCGSPVGTLAANDPGDKQTLNYDQVFIRDFVPSALAFLLKGEGEIVRNFLLDTLQLQSWEKTVDCYSPGQGLMPASFKVRTVPLDEGKYEEVLDPDFGESAIGRVAPVDSGLWWIILLRAYGKITGDYTLQEKVDVQTGIKLILNLCLSDGFDMFPSLLVTDGSCMIDRRMGIHGHPLEIQSLFYSALRCSREMLALGDGSKKLVRDINNRLSALSFHIREYYWVDMKKINEIYRYKTEEYSTDATNKFNIYPEQISHWLVDWIPEEGGYLIGNLQPAHMDFRPWSYHNGGSWPTLLWQFTLACIKMGRTELAWKAVNMAEKRLPREHWPEYYDTRNGKFIGKQSRLYQTWTIAGFLTSKMLLENPERASLLFWEEDYDLLEICVCALSKSGRKNCSRNVAKSQILV